jgi:SAM-dependent methyltransferase
MDPIELIIDLHARNERLGPGGDLETVRALDLAGLASARPAAAAPLEIADLGAGTGASALVLARSARAHVTAIDAAPRFVTRIAERAAEAGLESLIDARVGTMEEPGFAGGSLDAIWSEAAIYNIGFDAGVRAWRRFLKPDGLLVVSDLVWTTDRRPAEIDIHWRREYPGIGLPSDRMRTLEAAGYAPVGFFTIPRRCWTDNYFAPLRAGFDAFLSRHGRAPEARAIVAAEEAEMRLFDEFGAWFGYAFFLARRRDPS